MTPSPRAKKIAMRTLGTGASMEAVDKVARALDAESAQYRVALTKILRHCEVAATHSAIYSVAVKALADGD
jgi:hypothetical protein